MHTFGALDLAVLLAYLGGTTALGLWVGRRQRSSNDYFVAERSIPWWAVLFSVVATETSALTFISTPGLSYGAAPQLGRSRLSADRRRLRDRAHRRRIYAAAALLRGKARHRVRAARAAIRRRDAAIHLDRVHGDARARGLRARVRDGDSDRASSSAPR